MPLEESLTGLLTNTIKKIDTIVNSNYAKIRADQAKNIFDAEGAYNGRDKWKENAPAYKKSKGDRPIMQKTQQLYDAMSDPETFEEENWEGKILDINPGYLEADAIRPFHNIGDTPEDKAEIDKNLEKVIESGISKS